MTAQPIRAGFRAVTPYLVVGGVPRLLDFLTQAFGAQEVFFKSSDPARMASAIVEATAHFADPDHVAKVSRGLGEAMRGLEASQYGEHLADRGW